MGIFSSFVKGFQEGRHQAHMKNKMRRAERTLPSSVLPRLEGNKITIQITEINSPLRQAYLNATKTFANALSREPGISWTQNGYSVEIVFPTATMANKIYSQLRK